MIDSLPLSDVLAGAATVVSAVVGYMLKKDKERISGLMLDLGKAEARIDSLQRAVDECTRDRHHYQMELSRREQDLSNRDRELYDTMSRLNQALLDKMELMGKLGLGAAQ